MSVCKSFHFTLYHMLRYARTRGPLEEWADVEIYPQQQCKRVPIDKMGTPAELLTYLGIEEEDETYTITLYVDNKIKEYAEWTEVVEAARADHATTRLAIRNAPLSHPSAFIHWMQEVS